MGERIASWFAAGHRPLPWRAPDFPAWGVLVSEFMLQQTPVARVIPRLEEWLARWPTPADLAAVPPGEAVRAWDRLGYPRRALNLHAASVAITERHGGIVPSDVDELLALPGVGPYTARAVAAFAYGSRVPVVDVNVRRVLARAVRGVGEPGPARTNEEHALTEALLPADPARARLTNAGTMELGQTVCTARAPRCDSCPIADACAWRAAGYPAYTGPAAPRQKPYAGSDREVRGRILRELRANELPVPRDRIAQLWTDADQLERALRGLVADGLVEIGDGGFRLPMH
ncbi:A/G-specific adenine glycosylase [Homoserinibacter sp. GY 40078]|uniref:A/G-specific adenine glycosylase n=1 Tax=Homoserinibacter sp. GY 40078 TaxID=2603275 RepID=UPI0011CC8EF9|nr:A/G-specific adenine glycosylase [Homoserinibacter sp. GY 40078]TXK17808.1 A/G-specific adenine glycosylase [Homoserinibacter sp. GY 40078]